MWKDYNKANNKGIFIWRDYNKGNNKVKLILTDYKKIVIVSFKKKNNEL